MSESRIRVLPPEVAERIAAGEVVERPASAAKELVENALDAGAKRIVVETEAGGKVLLRVTDDGIGMTPEEVILAVQRHATSKLRTAEDLFNIHTLGFRGEALPSIAAVSELEIVTRTAEATEGTRLLIEGGQVRVHEAVAAQRGTRVTVQRLFYNLPVREKFLRADATEAAQITDWMQRLALANESVSFRLVHQGKEALLSPGSGDGLNAVVAILGRSVAREMLRLPEPTSEAPVTVRGFVGRPTLTRANRALQHLFVNGRAVRSPLFYRALDDAYRASMPSGRHPAAVVFLTVDPALVDVNVHPAKTEVRFQDEGEVITTLTRAIKAALTTGADPQLQEARLDEPYPEAPASRADRVAEPGALPFADAAINDRRPPQVPATRNWSNPSPARELGSAPASRGYEARPDLPAPATDAGSDAARTPAERPLTTDRPSSARTVDRIWPTGPVLSEPGDVELPTYSERLLPPPVREPTETSYEPPLPAVGELKLLGQVRDLFILAEGQSQFWIIDQHVAHERVLFDRMMADDRVGESAEPLLIPATVSLDRGQSLALAEHRQLLGELGYGVEPFGPGRWQLRAVPRGLLGRDYEQAFRDLADELAERSQNGQSRLRREELAAVAAGRSCKRAIKAGQKLSEQEMESLLASLSHAKNPHTCPHGRPVFLQLSEDDIAALFGESDCD